MGEDPVYARTPKNGVIVLNKDLKDPIEKAKTIAHEKSPHRSIQKWRA